MTRVRLAIFALTACASIVLAVVLWPSQRPHLSSPVADAITDDVDLYALPPPAPVEPRREPDVSIPAAVVLPADDKSDGDAVRIELHDESLRSTALAFACGRSVAADLSDEVLAQIAATLTSSANSLADARRVHDSALREALKTKVNNGSYERLAPGQEAQCDESASATTVLSLEDGTPIKVVVKAGDSMRFDDALRRLSDIENSRADEILEILKQVKKSAK